MTNRDRDDRRVQRWLDRESGFVGWPSEVGWDLLSRRLHARRTAGFACSPLFLLAFAAGGASFAGYRHASAAHEWQHVGLISLSMVCLALAVLGWQELAHRADRRIAATLDRRVGPSEPRGLLAVLGRRGAVVLAVAVCVQGALAVVLLAAHSGWLGWTYLANYLAGAALTWIGLRRVRGRTALAADASSLVIDHRLRSSDAVQACLPLVVLPALFIHAVASDTATDHFYLEALAWAAFYLNVFAVSWAQAKRRPRPSTSSERGRKYPPAHPAGPAST